MNPASAAPSSILPRYLAVNGETNPVVAIIAFDTAGASVGHPQVTDSNAWRDAF